MAKKIVREEDEYQGWRYSELFKVCIEGEEPQLVAAQNQLHAVEKLAAEIGIDYKAACGIATVYEPTPREILSLPRNHGILLEMKVMLDGKPEHICFAFNKVDAAMQAAQKWGLNSYDVQKQARFGVSRRSPMEMGG